jgi:hypothetical protein
MIQSLLIATQILPGTGRCPQGGGVGSSESKTSAIDARFKRPLHHSSVVPLPVPGRIL